MLAWMFRRPKVSVKYWEKGVETIVEKCIYKMNLLGAEDSSSSGVEEELRRRDRLVGYFIISMIFFTYIGKHVGIYVLTLVSSAC